MILLKLNYFVFKEGAELKGGHQQKPQQLGFVESQVNLEPHDTLNTADWQLTVSRLEIITQLFDLIFPLLSPSGSVIQAYSEKSEYPLQELAYELLIPS